MTSVAGRSAPSLRLRRPIQSIRRTTSSIAPYPSLIAIAFVLEPAIGIDASPLALTRVLGSAVAIGVALSVAWTWSLGRDRGAAAATISIAAVAVASNPLKVATFGTALVLLWLEARWARSGRPQIRIPWTGLTRFMNATLAILVALQVAGAAYTRLSQPDVPAPAAWMPGVAPERPDIYVLLADGHGRGDVLESRQLVDADPTAVVLVLSDHGPEDRLDWWDPSPDGITDRMANLFWARTPGQSDVFPADVSLVNVFPLLFNAYFGTSIALHPNDLWFGPVIGGSRFVPFDPAAPEP